MLACLDLPQLRGHPEKHESAVGVEHGKRRQGKRRTFSAEYKAEAVRLVGESGKRDGGLNDQRARGTRALATRESASAHGARNPKKSDGLLRQGERVRFAFIETEKAGFPVTLMCRMLAVSRAGFYAWRRRPAAARTR